MQKEIKKTNNFFHEAGNTKPYFKATLDGFAGTGKSFTAMQIAIGLHKRIKSKKPIVMFDTEKAAKFHNAMCRENGIELMVREGRTLADLKETMRILREESYADILIVDSITHIWDDYLQAYARKVNRSRLQFQDWGIIKPTWRREFTEPYVNDPYHFIVCGRAAYDYEHERNEETGKMELFKSGVKMRAEGETAYESDVFIYMERFEDLLGEKKEIYRQATILKDRSSLIDGKTFKNPTYDNFSPTIEMMLSNPTKPKSIAERDSAELFKTEEDTYQWKKEKEKWLEEIESYLVSVWPSSSAEEKKCKVDVLEFAFKTRSWTAIKELSPEKLRIGYGEVVKFGQKFLLNKRAEITPTKK